MTAAPLDSLMRVYRDGLLQDVIPFWMKHSPDREHGGFLNQLDRDGSVYGTDKGVWLQGRAAWMFARLYNDVERRDDWLQLSRHGLDFLRRHCFDKDGRMFFQVTRDGRPLRKRRYLFSETFAIIALAEYARASGDDAARQQARDLFKLVWRYHTTPGLCEPKLIPQTRQLKGLAMPMILMATIQVLRMVDDDPLYEQVIDDALHQIIHHFMKPQFNCVLETVGPDGEFLDEPPGREVNPGHAIEVAWFMLEEARHRHNDRAIIDKAVQILDWSLAIGWDNEFGGLYYFRDCRGFNPPQYEHDMKLWWPMTEALYATLLAYHLTREQRHLDWHHKLLDWSLAHFPDPQHGEWFGYLHRDGSVSHRFKGNLWKGIFHLPRAQLYCWKLLEQMKAGAKP